MTYSPDVLALNPELRQHGTRRKYANVPTVINGIRFDSKKEARDYLRLKELERAGVIANLILQPSFVLQPAFTDSDGKRHRSIRYKADFMWRDVETGRMHILDSKGVKTQSFLLKEKLFRRLYPQYIFEVE